MPIDAQQHASRRTVGDPLEDEHIAPAGYEQRRRDDEVDRLGKRRQLDASTPLERARIEEIEHERWLA